MAVTEEQLKQLSDPKVHIQYGIEPLWHPDSKVGGKLLMLPNYSADQCRDILDSIIGAHNWQSEPRGINGKLYFAIGINIEKEVWIFKADAGGERNSTKKGINEVDRQAFHTKTEASNAFVRAAKSWGIGRHLKNLPDILLDDAGSYKPKTDKGVILYTSEQQAAYCNGFSTTQWLLKRLYFENKKAVNEDSKLLESITILKKGLIK